MSHSMTKPTKWPVCPAKTSLAICPVWSVFAVCLKKLRVLSYLLSTQRRLIRLCGSEAWMGTQVILLVLWCSGSNCNHDCINFTGDSIWISAETYRTIAKVGKCFNILTVSTDIKIKTLYIRELKLLMLKGKKVAVWIFSSPEQKAHKVSL